ncbi:PAS domain-containing hybrid sensor histidine kinase/response regulator [Aquimarina algicola]|uniref:histidine kinase n=1 Tax=Aquimarina algicola TaxID=2589995 RepID=A0A504JE10_9FLAO|nr:ATP-binding protein [Aquimarina algicola]TPN84810.1 response regulator [Aquimarina algicola]
MIKNWFHKIISPKITFPPKKHEEQEIIDLIDFLIRKIDKQSITINLNHRIKEFQSASLAKKISLLPQTYLVLEELIIEKNYTKHISKNSIRDNVSNKFQHLFKYKSFKLIFNPLNEQELILCKSFLINILQKSSELIGDYNDNQILVIKKQLDTPYDLNTLELIKERKKLLDFSNQIFLKLRNSLGINAVTNIYLVIYKEHFQSYYLLESFTSILNVIPEEILAEDLINLPSKQQMHKMLQKQLYNLEEINTKLTEEIIERKKVEEELKYSEHLNTTVLETAMDGIILANSKGTVLNWNKQAENILGLKREDTIGKNIFSLVPSKLRRVLKSSIHNYIKTGNNELINKRVETSIQKKDGSVVYIELTIIAIKSKNDYLFHAFFRDITNKKIIDNEIREAKVIAEKSAKAKSIFLSNMSHEIRTPLNVILGLTSILQKSDFSNLEIDKKNLDGIQFSAENLLTLINDILDFSKIEAGKLALHKTDFNLRELISNISRGFKIKAEEKGLTYKMAIDTSVPKFIIGDQLRLNQILLNLLGNAIKFTHKGEISISVIAKETTNNKISIDFSVRDTGVGIPQNKLKNIFESFYQIHKPGKNKIEGTGLGLAISKQLIELQGGTLHAESRLDFGSTFNFSINYDKSNFKYSESTKTGIISEQEDQILSQIKVLVVEDNKMNQFFIKQLLSNWNIDVQIADHGKIALEKLENNVFDLILMDMHMPVMDGAETTIQIRKMQDPKVSKIPIVACSADVFPESKKKAFEAGMDFYLTKPLGENELREILLSLTHRENNTEQNQPVQQKKTKFCDLSFLQKTFHNDSDIIINVLQIFVDETTLDYKKLEKAIQSKDIDFIREIAHKLKSSFRTIGLHDETNALVKIEKAARENTDFNIILNSFTFINNRYLDIIKELKSIIKELNSFDLS